MSYTYSQALAGAYLADCFADTALCVRLNSIRTADQFSFGGKTTDTCRRSRYGMTCGHLTDEDGGALLTWYQEAFLAKTYPLPETEPVLPAKNPRSGFRCSESFGRFDRSTSSWRTPLNLFGEDSILSSKDWTKAGTMRNGVCWERTTWVRPISENDAGFSVVSQQSIRFPTPKARDCIPEGFQSGLKRGSPSLPTFVRMIPTPTVNGNNNRKGISKTSGDGLATWVQKQRWRTPDVHGGGRSMKLTKGITHRASGHLIQIRLADQVGGKLSPDWTEWLMGFPVGFTALEDSATPKCRFAPPSHGQSCMNESMNSEKELEEKRKQ